MNTEAQATRMIKLPEAKGGYQNDGGYEGIECVCCGRPVKREKYAVIIGNGGNKIVHPADEELASEIDGGFMGRMSIGSECRKLVPAEYLITK